jgi:formate C-acetyltransferase
MADSYADALHQFFASHFAGKKNCHGGNIEYELHSARAFVDMGEKTNATPDGRRAGEETSKNGSPSNGADNQGVTALLRSASTLDLSLSDSGACLDCMLHPSAIQGEGGINVLYSILRTYHDRGGASIHFNVFSSDMLREAQANPEKYKNLQVRVCGWNVLWNNLARKEQDAYILRAENIQ